MTTEPTQVQEARRIIREWELRDGHGAYVAPLDGGWRGYQAGCWDCDWRGPEHLHGPEARAMPGTAEGRAHKRLAQQEAAAHREATRPVVADATVMEDAASETAHGVLRS